MRRRSRLPTPAARRVGVLTCVLVGLAVLAGAAPAGAQDPSDTDQAQELAERWAPVYMLKQQDAECDSSGEQYEPTSVDIVLGNPEIALRQVSPGDPVVLFGPSGADLYELGDTFYLEYPGLSLTPGCDYERDFRRFQGDRPSVVYAHIVQEEGHPDQLAVQYWTFWYYNDWNNKHETDWEFTQLLFDAASVGEALAVGPARVGYAQHEGGERADWDDDKVEKSDGRPVVYPSAGSHASYFSSAVYLGRSGSEGFGCDNTDGPSRRVDPDVVLLPDAPSGPDDEFAWLGFEGRWGERHNGPFNGPTGPAAKSRYLEPVSWHDELRSRSVVIPSGDSMDTTVINGFCDIVEWGSGLLISYLSDPLAMVITALAVGWFALFLIRRTVWKPREPSPLRARRRAGQIIGGGFAMYRRRPGTFILVGLVFVPMAMISGLVIGALAQLTGFGALVDLIEDEDRLGSVVAFIIGGFANIVGFVFVQAAISVIMDAHDHGRRLGAPEAYRAVFANWRPLLGALVRALVIVVVLLLTVIGAPIGVWLLVRYQLASQSVMLDEVGGREALRRSAELIDGRWMHTALMVLLIQAVVTLVSFVVGLVILVLFTGLPLWAFNISSALVAALLTPAAAAAYTLLYGDRVAAQAFDPDEPALQEA